MTRKSTSVGGKGSAVETPPGSGVWRLRALAGYAKRSDGTDNTSRPIQKRATVHGTKRDAQTALAALVAGADAGTVSIGTDTVAAYFERWLDVASTGWKAGTERRNRCQVAQVVEALGPSKRLSALGPADLTKVFADLTRAGSSPANVHRAYAVVHRALTVAVEDNVIPRNPAATVKKRLPTVTRQDPRPATADEVFAVVRETRNIKRTGPLLADLFTLCAATALRDGEAAALRWQDVDRTGRSLMVHASIETASVKETGTLVGTHGPEGSSSPEGWSTACCCVGGT